MEIRRATWEEMGAASALLKTGGLPPLPAAIPLPNVLVGLEQRSVVGVVALEVAARSGLVLWAAATAEHQASGGGTSLGRSLMARAHELGLREIYAVTRDTSKFLDGLGFSPASHGAVPDEIRFMQTFRDHCDESTEIVRLGLEARI